MQANMLEHAILSRSTPLASTSCCQANLFAYKVSKMRSKSGEIIRNLREAQKSVAQCVLYVCSFYPSSSTRAITHHPSPPHHTSTRQPDPPNPIPGNSPCTNCAKAKGRHIVFSQTRTAKQQRSPHLRKRGINITATWPASLARCLLTNNALIPIPHAACRLAATMSSLGTRGHAARSLKHQTP
jgi:hypothetical protein